jgi:hypothetical protein
MIGALIRDLFGPIMFTWPQLYLNFAALVTAGALGFAVYGVASIVRRRTPTGDHHV